MHIAFFTNTLNHHQVGLADELYRQTNGEYTLVETTPLNQTRRKMGFIEYERPYKLKAYESDENKQKALEIAINADVAIMGADSFDYLEARIKRTNKLTFSFSERWLKRGLIGLSSPRLLKLMCLYHFHGGHNKPWYILSASAYLKDDFRIMHAFKDKCFKSGYFTLTPENDIENIINSKREGNKIKILWVARYLIWKHPEQMVDLASQLQEKNVEFEINMVGSGALFENITQQIKERNLSNCVHQLGNRSNDEVLELMRTHHIFCFTSDRNEGWGAVLNETMAQGCCPVSSIETGSTPYLIKDGINGFTFDLSNKNDLYEKVMYLVAHPEKREKMSIEAYRTIHNLWNPFNAAKSLLTLIDDLQNKNEISIIEGPCSKA